jgi:hypothetical protein
MPFSPELSNVSASTGMELTWRQLTPKVISESGTRLLYLNEPQILEKSPALAVWMEDLAD